MTFTYPTRITLELFDHPYNGTITNERALEIPIARRFVERQPRHTRGLEVGNVLAHYDIGPERRIIDRNEVAPGVENLDLFEIGGHYDWIVSVSTIEHVRWPENRHGASAAIEYLRGLVTEGGQMLLTLALGANGGLDDALANGERWGANQIVCYVRDDPATTEWRQARTFQVPPYGPRGANAVWIGEWIGER